MLLVESCHTQVLESCYPGSNEAEVTHGSEAMTVYHKQLLECCNTRAPLSAPCAPCPSFAGCKMLGIPSIYAALASSTGFSRLTL